MSRVIEEEVVKMQFDNKGFESNVKESMSTLDKLKAALHFKDVDMSPLEKAFQKTEATATQAGFHIRDVWLKMSEVFEYQVARKIMTAGENLVKSLSVDNVADGWSKYEQKTGNVQTLLNSTGKTIDEVNGYLEQLMWYSDETSFGFTDMTSALSTMVSSGGDIEKLIPMIEGMGNATAYAGKGAAEFSRVIYNLNQSYSQGFLSTMDWRSVEMAGASSKQLKQYLMEAAEEVGTIKKGTSDIADWSTYLSKKFITSEAMEIAFKRFAEYTEAVKEAVNSGQYATATEVMEAMATDGFDEVSVAAFNAAQNYKSFSEAVDATKDAVSSGWLSTFELIFGNFEEAKELWTTVGNGFWEIFASGAERRNNIIGELMNDPLDTFQDKLQHCGISLEQFESVFRSIAKDNGVAIDYLIARYGGFDKFIRSGNATSKKLIKETLSALTDTHKTNIKATDDALSSLEKYQEAINKVMTDPAIGTGAERFKNLTEAGYDAVGTQKLINHLYEKNGKTYNDMSVSASDLIEVLGELNETELESIGLNEEQIANLKELAETADQTGESLGDLIARINKPSGRELFFESISNVMDILIDTIEIVKSSFRNVFPEVAVQSWYDAIEAVTIATREVKAFLENEENADKLSKSLGGLFSILKLITMVTKGAISIAFKVLKAVLEEFNMDILSLTANIGNGITTFVKWIEQQELVKRIAKGISGIIKGIVNAMRNAVTAISKSFSAIKKDLKEFWDEFVNLPIIQEMISDFTKVLDSIRESFSNIKFSLTGADGEASKFFSKIKDKASLDKLNTALTKVYDKLKGFKNILVVVKNSFVNFFREIKNGKSVAESFKSNFSGIIDFFTNLKKTITDFFSKIFGEDTDNKFKQLGETIHDFFTSLDADKVTAIVLTAVFGLFAINLLRLTNAVSDTVTAIGSTFNTLKTVINSYMKRQKSILLQIAEAIVIVAAALYVLSTIPKDKMKTALTALYAISGCIAVLVIIMGVITKISNAGLASTAKLSKLSEMTFSLVGLAGTIVLATFALKKIAELNLGEGIIKKIGIVVGAVGAMAVIAGVLSKIKVSDGGIAKTTITLLAIAASLYLVTEAMIKIAAISKTEDELNTITNTMIKMMAGLALVAFAAGNITGFSALGILAVVFLFEKLMPRIEEIVNYDYTKINEGLEKNKAVIDRIGLMVGAMVIIGGIFGKGFGKFGGGLIKLIAAMALMLIVTKKASELSTAGISRGTKFMKALTDMLTELVVAMAVYNLASKLGKDQKGGGFGLGTFLGIALALGVMALIAKKAGSLNPTEMKQGLKFISVLTLLIDAMFIVAGIAGKGDGASFKNLALMLGGISFILGLMVTLSIIKDKDGLYTAMTAIAVVILSLSILFKSVSKITSESQKTSKGVKKSGLNSGSIFAVLAGVAAIIGGMIWLSKQPVNKVVASAAGITVAMLTYATVFKAVQKNYGVANATNKKRIATIISALLGVAVVAGAIIAISKLGGDAKNVASAAAGITVGLLGFAVCVKALGHISGTVKKDMKYKQLVASLGGAIGALIVVATAIGILSHIGGEPGKMIASATAITIGLVGVAICAAAMGFAMKICKDTKLSTSLPIIIGAIGAMAAVATAIGVLSSLNVDSKKMNETAIAIGIGTVAVGLAAILMATATKIAGNVNPLSAIIVILGSIAAMAAVAFAMYELSKHMESDQVSKIVELAPSFAILMGALGGMAIALALAGTIVNVNIISALAIAGIAIAAFIVFVGILIGLGYWMNECEKIAPALETGLDAFVLICEKVGTAFGKLIGNFIDAIDQTVILGLGETLNTVMGDDYLGGFFKKVQEVPEEAVQGAKNIAGVVAAWIGVSWLDFVANLATFGKSGTITFDFAALGTAIAGFCDSIKGLSEDDLKKAQIAAGIGVAMAEFSKNMPRHGWWEKITGKKTSIAEFGTEMEGFAAGVISMAHTAAQLTDEDVENINTLVTAVEPLNTLAQSLDNTGGLLAAIAGDDDLGTFGSTLIPFAEGLMQFCGKAALIKTLTPDFATDIADVATAVEPLNTLAQSLENTGGLLGRIVGNDDLATFGATLVPFADSLAAFITTVRENGLNDESLATDIQMIADATTPLAELADKLSDDEINFAGFGTLQLDEFGKDIKKYAKALKDASDSFEGASIFNLNRIAQTIEPVSALADLSTNENFTKDNIKQIVDAVSEMAELDLEELSDAFDEDVTVVDSLKNLLNDMVVTLDEKKNESKTRFKNFALDDMIELALGIRSSINIHIIPAINDMVKAIFDKLDTVMDPTKFKIYGKNLSKGLSEGIDEGSGEAEESTTKLAKKVEKTLKDGLKEESPSKLSRKFGIYWDEGLANGIAYGTEEVVKTTEDLGDAVIKGLEVYNSKVYNAAESMGSSASDSLNNGLSSSLQKIFGMDDDFNPVIRPRLDLTDVTNGARRIGGLFGNRSIGVNGDAQNGSTIGGNGTVVFNQYNNSPKALPRIDIYRNTSNLLAMARIKGALT